MHAFVYGWDAPRYADGGMEGFFERTNQRYRPDAGTAAWQRMVLSHFRPESLESTPQPSLRTVPLTTEEEGVALLAGAWLGGERGVLLMQSSGVGNCVNMLSLTRVCRFPLLMLVTMRGEWGEFNPWQVPMGQNTAEILRLTGALAFPVARGDEAAETVRAAGRMVFEGPASAAVLIAQAVVGVKTFED